MGITNQVPSSRLIQPGVIDNSAARPASPFEGQCIFQKDTDQLLVWNGTAWVIPNSPAQNPMGLELVTTTTCTSGGTASGGVVTIGTTQSSVVVENAFSSTYDNYRIMISGGATSASDPALRLQLGTAATGHDSNLTFQAYGSNTVSGANKTNVAFFDWAGSGRPSGLQMSCDIRSPFLATNTYFFSHFADQANTGTSHGRYSATTSFTSFVISADAGTMTGGTIRVYGYRNS
jgi:hypothetical protein